MVAWGNGVGGGGMGPDGMGSWPKEMKCGLDRIWGGGTRPQLVQNFDLFFILPEARTRYIYEVPVGHRSHE